MLKIVIDITALGYRLLWHGMVPLFRQQRCNRIYHNQYHESREAKKLETNHT